MGFSILLLINITSVSSGCLFLGFRAQEFSCEHNTIILSILQPTADIRLIVIQDGHHKNMDYTILLLVDIAQTSFLYLYVGCLGQGFHF